MLMKIRRIMFEQQSHIGMSFVRSHSFPLTFPSAENAELIISLSHVYFNHF